MPRLNEKKREDGGSADGRGPRDGSMETKVPKSSDGPRSLGLGWKKYRRS
jgi:hypothetical protein